MRLAGVRYLFAPKPGRAAERIAEALEKGDLQAIEDGIYVATS